MGSLAFNALLLEVSDGLSTEQLERMKFLCGEDVKKRDQERCTTGHKFFTLLRERGRLSPDNTELLCDLLTKIQRQDLCDKVLGYSGDRALRDPRQAHRDDLDHAAEVLSQTLGRQWRKLGRKLGLSEVNLDSIAQKHPSDLEETTVELVRVWRKCRPEQVSVEALVQALRNCDLNMSADAVEEAL